MSPFIKSVLSYGSALVLSIAIICLVFPVIPGVQFTGGIGSALGILILELGFTVLAFLAGIIALVIVSISSNSFSTKRILNAFETLGFYGTGAVSIAAVVVTRTVALMIAAAILSSFSFTGFLPALAASAALVLASAPAWLLGGNNKKNFEEQLAKLRSTMTESQIARAVEELPAGSVVIVPPASSETSSSEAGTTRVPQPLLVRGNVRLPEGFAVTGAQARVRLLDTTYADAPSQVLVEQIIAILDLSAPIEFELRGAVPPASGMYTVAVHVKANPDPTRGEKYNEIERGDCLTTQSYPVTLSAEAPAEVAVEVFTYAGPAVPHN